MHALIFTVTDHTEKCQNIPTRKTSSSSTSFACPPSSRTLIIV